MLLLLWHAWLRDDCQGDGMRRHAVGCIHAAGQRLCGASWPARALLTQGEQPLKSKPEHIPAPCCPLCCAGDLVQNLTAAGQEVSAALHELAARDPRFRKGTSRGKGGLGGRGGRGRGQVRRGAGLPRHQSFLPCSTQ